MKALIFKDLLLIKKQLLLALGLFIVSIFARITTVPILCIILSLQLVLITLSHDVKSNFEKYLFSMPISKTQYLLSKFFLPVLLGIIASAFTLYILITKSNFLLTHSIFISIYIFIFTILLNSIFLCFIFKYGIEKARYAVTILLFSIIVICSFFIEKIMYLFKCISKIPINILALFLFIVSILAIITFTNISLYILKNKEY